VVGPSQEIHDEILKTRETFKKPVVMVTNGMMASGAFYAAVAADKIVTAPGSMIGSIGVIMEFMNLEKLYDWAKVSRFSINTGKYKDSGAEYRAMRPDERAVFQSLINDVFEQFKEAVAAGRNLQPEVVAKYADGRVFTGHQAVEMGFADQIGTIDDAYEVAADLADIDDYEIFEIPKHRPGFLDMIQGPDDDNDDASSNLKKGLSALARFDDHMRLQNQPLMIMPGANW
jgi:protease-4